MRKLNTRLGLIGIVLGIVVSLFQLEPLIRDRWFSPKILEFQVLPKQITRGESSKLRWKVSQEPKADVVLLDGKQVDLSDEKPIRPEKDTTYTLVVRNQNGETRAQERITVLPIPVRVSLTTDRTVVSKGETVTVAWEVSGDVESVFMRPF